jgi:MerR family copper efflux transcriptional regulator
MRIKEFERATGLKRSTIRFYEAQGVLHPEYAANGYRIYTEAQVEGAKLAQIAQQLGFSIREIAEAGEAWREGVLTPAEKSTILRAKLAECREKQARLTALVAHLEALADWVDGGEVEPKPMLNAEGHGR